MDFVGAIQSGFRNYVTFSGRASRSEFWYWTLFAVLVTSAGGIVDAALFRDSESGLAGPLVSLALFLPGLAVSARRLHDRDRTGWWLLLYVTIIGGIVLLVWYCMRGTPGPNRYGPDPLGYAPA
jgi:uncharacterized membrane protein YhaH (DUF805 family)